ncbi:MAG TPA: universal stress protein [Gemmatimonadales bacterium]|nr:universal stress protein [Gemmatimonadales bacterium]
MPPGGGDLQRIVVGVDGSPEGEHAHAMASALARRCGARILAVAAEGAVAPPTGARRIGGVPGVELPRFAESVAADLLVLGRRPRNGIGPPLGSVGDAVVRRSRVACLLVPLRIPALRRVLVALDPGPRGPVVRDFAVRFAAAAGVELASISVRRWREGELSTEILAEAVEVGADAIAFGVHRGGPLGGAEQMGVSHHLVREAPTALLTIPL